MRDNTTNNQSAIIQIVFSMIISIILIAGFLILLIKDLKRLMNLFFDLLVNDNINPHELLIGDTKYEGLEFYVKKNKNENRF